MSDYDLEYTKKLFGYGVTYLGRDGEALAYGNGYDAEDDSDPNWATDVQVRNTITHAHTSAKFAYSRSSELAEKLGDFKELPSPNSYETADEFADQWNNEVGRRIAEYAKGNSLSEAEIDDLIMDAFNNGDLIWDRTNDPRIDLVSGDPRIDPTWTAPTGGWDGSSLGRDYALSDDFVEDPIGFAAKMAALGMVSAAAAPLFEAAFIGQLFALVQTAIEQTSPLVLDIDDSGTIELVSLANSETYWDIDNDGFAEWSGWVTGGDGLLAQDLNDNGVIDNQTELFGSGTMDGFTALSAIDSNDDGVIDSSDTEFAGLLVWIDANENGYSEDVELYTLSDLDIVSIDLNATEVSETNQGHTISHTSSFTVDDGINPPDVRIVHDVWFAHDNVNTRYASDLDIDPVTIYVPVLRGYGTLSDTPIAATLDASLYDLLEDVWLQDFTEIFADDADPYADVKDILYRWAGVDGVSPTSRGPNIDGRDLAFLEALTGQEFLQRGWNPNPFADASRDLREAFDIAHNNFYARILSQTAAAELFEGDVTYNMVDDAVEGITGLDHNAIDALETIGSGAADKLVYWSHVVRLIEHTVGVSNLVSGDYNYLDAAITATDAGLDLGDVVSSIGFEGDTGDYYGGTSGDDTHTAGSGSDLIEGFNGHDTLTGGAGHDTIEGGNGNDILTGGYGSDFITGGAGDDTYVFASGDAADTLREDGTGTDKIKFGAGIEVTDLTMTRVSNTDLLIEIDAGAGGGNIVIEDYFNNIGGGGANGIIEEIEFYDTSTFDLDGQNWTLTGTAGNDYLTGVDTGGLHNDTIYAGAGIDTVYADTGDDIVYGGADNDKLWGEAGYNELYGEAGNDQLHGGDNGNLLDGGEGSDTVRGGSGSDTYVYTSGDDLMTEGGFGYGAGGTDIIDMPTDVIELDLAFARTGDNLIITVDGLGTINVKDHYYVGGAYAFETIRFADTSTLALSSITLTVTGTSSGETLNGASTHDTIYGLAGNDTINGLAGDDKLYGGDDNDILDGGNDNDRLYGGDGNDTLRGVAGNDEFWGGAGDDTIYTGAGNDTVYYESGDDIVQEAYSGSSGGTEVIEMPDGISEEDLTFTRLSTAAYDMVITVAGLGTLTVNNQHYTIVGDQFETIRFSDTSTLTLANVVVTTFGTSSGQTISGITNGGSVNDVIYGLAGNDTLNGNSGNDTLYGGDDNDTVNGGDGDDILYGDAGNDSISGGAGNDYIEGGAGNDTITDTTSGNDTHVYSAGLDSIYDWSGTDVLRLSNAATTINDIALSDIGSHHKITITASTDEITLMWYDSGSAYRIETIEFMDGFYAPLNNWVSEWSFGSSGNDTSTGNGSSNVQIGKAGNDTMDGNGGNDYVHGGAGDDTIEGGDGADLLHGGDDDDILYGEDGLDTLFGGAGEDTFVFQVASAFNNVDVIKDFDTVEDDKLNINDIVDYDPMSDDIADFLSFTNSGANSQMFVDRDGTGGTYSSVQVALMEGVTDLDAEDLLTGGYLIAA